MAMSYYKASCSLLILQFRFHVNFPETCKSVRYVPVGLPQEIRGFALKSSINLKKNIHVSDYNVINVSFQKPSLACACNCNNCQWGPLCPLTLPVPSHVLTG